jgi:DNA-binding transcriptional ArsR family regulator
MTAGEIDERFQHAWPTTSRHLRVLEQAGLLVHEKQGRTRIYRVNTEKIEVVKEWLEWLESSRPKDVPIHPPEKSKVKNRPRRAR